MWSGSSVTGARPISPRGKLCVFTQNAITRRKSWPSWSNFKPIIVISSNTRMSCKRIFILFSFICSSMTNSSFVCAFRSIKNVAFYFHIGCEWMDRLRVKWLSKTKKVTECQLAFEVLFRDVRVIVVQSWN